MSRLSLARTRRQDLGPSLSLDEQNLLPSASIRSVSYGGQTVTEFPNLTVTANWNGSSPTFVAQAKDDSVTIDSVNQG